MHSILAIAMVCLALCVRTESTAPSSLPSTSTAARGTPIAPHSCARMPATMVDAAAGGGASPLRPGVVGGSATAAYGMAQV
jgi:hypothetical protein